MALPDIQDQRDERGIELDHVGIAGVAYPVRFNDGFTTSKRGRDIRRDRGAPRGAARHSHEPHGGDRARAPSRIGSRASCRSALKLAADRLDVDGVRVGLALPMAFTVARAGVWQASLAGLRRATFEAPG